MNPWMFWWTSNWHFKNLITLKTSTHSTVSQCHPSSVRFKLHSYTFNLSKYENPWISGFVWENNKIFFSLTLVNSHLSVIPIWLFLTFSQTPICHYFSKFFEICWAGFWYLLLFSQNSGYKNFISYENPNIDILVKIISLFLAFHFYIKTI